jgi:hypothetical protein
VFARRQENDGMIRNDPIRTDAFLMARDGLSYAQIGKLLDVPKGTIGRWAVEDRWRERVVAEHARDRARVAQQIAGFLAAELPKSLDVLRELRDNADGQTPAKVRLDAGKTLIAFAAQAPRVVEDYERLQVIDAESRIAGVADETDLESLTTAELEERQRRRVISVS